MFIIKIPIFLKITCIDAICNAYAFNRSFAPRFLRPSSLLFNRNIKTRKKVTGDLFLHKNGRTELQWNWIMLKSIWMKIYCKILLIAVCFFVSVHSLVYSVIIFHSQHTHCQLQVLFWHNINVWIFICSLRC